MANDLNFLPEDYLQIKAQRKTNMLCLVLFVVVLGAVGAGFWLTHQRNTLMARETVVINDKMTQASAALQTLEVLEKKKSEMLAKAQVTQLLMEPVPRSLLVATVTNNLPKGVSLLDYELICREIKLAQPVAAPQPQARRRVATQAETQPQIKKFQTVLKFTGIAYSDQQVAQLVANLSGSNLFEQVYLTYTEEHRFRDEDTQEKLRKFNIVAVLAPDAKASEDDVRWAQSQYIRSL